MGKEGREVRLALRLMGLLQHQGKSVYALAKAAGLDVHTVQRVMKGETAHPSAWTLAALAKALHVSLDALLPGEDR